MGAASKIIVLLGSVRDGRNGERVARFVCSLLQKNHFDVTLFDPLKMSFSHLKQPLHFMHDQSQAPQWMLDANQKIKEADGFVVVSAEYNSCIPPALSNMMDHFPPASYRHRPCGIVAYSVGSFGGMRSAFVLRPFLSELGMISTPFHFLIPTVTRYFSADGQPLDDLMTKNGEKLVQELQWYVSALKKQKEISGVPSE